MRRLLTIGIGLLISSNVYARQRPALIVDRIDVSDPITIQGCVKRAENPATHILTRVTQWPIVRIQPEPSAVPHYWTNAMPVDLDSFVDDTIQIEGTVASIKSSEIELEPGVHKFGKYVEFERPGRNVLVNPTVAGVQPAMRPARADVPLTLVEVGVNKAFRVMRGCLGQPGSQR